MTDTKGARRKSRNKGAGLSELGEDRQSRREFLPRNDLEYETDARGTAV